MDIYSHKTKESFTPVGLIRVFSVMLAALSAITVFDDLHRFLELFSHFKLQYFLASFIFTVIFLILKESKWAAVMTMITALNLSYILPWYFDSVSKNRGEFVQLKLLHSNVQTSNDRYNRLIELVMKESPDILTVQEVNKTWMNELEKLEGLLPHKLIRTREDNFGIAVFSKYSFDSGEYLYLGSSKVPSLKIAITIDKQQITLITSHPVPPVNSNYYKSRNSQLNELSLLSKNVNQPLILIGDFNVTMWSHDYLPLERNTPLSNSRKGFGVLPTWPAKLLPFMIPVDHCLVSDEFSVLDMKVGRDIGSDHLPLVITLGLHK